MTDLTVDPGATTTVSRQAPRVDAVLPLLALVACAALAGAGVALASEADAVDAVRAGLVVTWAVAGAIVAARPALRPLGTVVLGGTLVAGAGFVASAALGAGIGGAADPVAVLVRALAVAAVPAFGLHLLLALPDGRLATIPRRAAVMVAYGAAAVTALAVSAAGAVPSPWPVLLAGAVALAGGGVASNRRYLKATAAERQRLQWFGCATAVLVEAVVVVLALRLLVGWPPRAHVVLGALSALLPASLAAGVSPRLAGRAGRLLLHTVSLTGLSSVVLGVYVLVVLGLGRVPGGEERSLLLLSMAAAGVAAFLYLPTRARLSEFANRLVYGEREAPDAVLRTFGSRLSRAIPMDELLLQLAESLRKTMGATEIWTGADGVYDRVVSVPERGPRRVTIGAEELPVLTRGGVRGNAWLAVWARELLDGRNDGQVRVAPVTNSGELLGLIVVTRPATAESFTEEDERVLSELARQVGLALHNVQLDSALQASLDEVRRHAEELRASRARIVAASDAARRQIERNLHDGAQQRLVALSVHLRIAEDVMGDDPDEARTMLAQLRDDLHAAVQELRDLAHGIYPPLLMDRGLTEALRSAAARAALPTEVKAPGVGRYSQEVEAAVYFCCLEAVQNAGKHAGPGATISITLSEDGGSLRFEVADTGAGFDIARHGRGAGFVNMADRVGAMGGDLQVESTPGTGTTVRGRVPLVGGAGSPAPA